MALEAQSLIEFAPIERDDLEMLRDWRNNPKVREICREYRLLTMTHQEKWYDEWVLDKDHVVFKIIDRLDKRPDLAPIGICGITFIDWRSRHGLLSFYIAEEPQSGKPIEEYYAAILTELQRVAFDDLNLHVLRAEIYAFDPRKEYILKAGFTETGKRREQYFHNGRFWDIIIADVISGMG